MCHHDNWLDDTTLEFPRMGFWVVHIMGAMFVFYLGMRFAMHRYPVFKMFKFLRMLTK